MTYVKQLILGILALTVLGGGLNLLIDPFDIFGTPQVERLNTRKSLGSDRLTKPLQAVVRRPETIILGTSRCLHGLDPKDAPGRKVYNLSVPGALADELAALSRHVATATTAHRLILCLDFVSFNDARSQRAGFYDEVLGPWGLWRSVPRTVFSYAALKRSRNTLRDSLRGKPNRYRSDGFRPFEPRDKNGGMITPVASFLSPGGAYRDFPGTQAKLAELPPLFKDLRAAGIELTVVVPAIHAVQLEAIAEAGLWSMFENWKRGLTAACAVAEVHCWDFAGYFPETTENLSPPPRNFGDASHFQPSLGQRMLKRIADSSDAPGFGRRLTPVVITDHLRAIRRAQAAYRKAHKADVAAVHKIAATYGLRPKDQGK